MSKPSAAVAKGRAVKARPLACLLPSLSIALAVAALAAPVARAEQPDTPVLVNTNPPSPATAPRPLIRGDGDGVIATGVKRQSVHSSLFSGPVGRAVEPSEFTITVYENDQTCSSPAAIVGTGTAGQLEGAGIPITKDAAPDAITTYYANQTDPEDPTNPSPCSLGIDYQQVSTPPTPPTFTSVTPPSPADENLPHLIGSAATSSTVTIYTSPSCAPGSLAASGTASVFAATGIQVSVPDNSLTNFYATATLAGFVSSCSSSTISYQEVTGAEGPGGGGESPGGGETPGGGSGPGGVEPPVPNPKGRPPAPTLRTIPGYAANDNTPVVTGKAPGAGRVEIYGSAGCKGSVLAEGSAGQFTGPGFEIQVANDTTVTFYGVSIDGGGDRSACSEEAAVFTEDSTAPHTRITSGPAAKTRKRKAIFRFADISGETAVTFFCKLDGRGWKACRAPLKLGGLSLRSHVLKVKAVDAAGNTEQGMAKRRFRVVRDY